MGALVGSAVFVVSKDPARPALHRVPGESVSVAGSGSSQLLISPEAEHPQRNTNTPHATCSGGALYLHFFSYEMYVYYTRVGKF